MVPFSQHQLRVRFSVYAVPNSVILLPINSTQQACTAGLGLGQDWDRIGMMANHHFRCKCMCVCGGGRSVSVFCAQCAVSFGLVCVSVEAHWVALCKRGREGDGGLCKDVLSCPPWGSGQPSVTYSLCQASPTLTLSLVLSLVSLSLTLSDSSFTPIPTSTVHPGYFQEGL